MRVAFIGPVGAGKTTQAQRFARALPHYNPRLSSGELVRAHKEAGTELGRRMEGYYDRGEAVPDGMLLPLILPRVRREHGWILDNFPASLAQAEALDAELRGREAGGLSRVVALEGPTDGELVERVLSGRVHSRTTGLVYHLVNDPPPRPEESRDPGPFERREDDTEEALGHRLEAHRREYAALKERYEARGVLSVVEARRSIDEVAEDVLETLGHPERPEFYALGR
jgi:adenylate kinase